LGVGLKGGDARTKPRLSLSLGVHIELLLSLSREVLILSSRIVLPRVEIGHGDGKCLVKASCMPRVYGSGSENASKLSRACEARVWFREEQTPMGGEKTAVGTSKTEERSDDRSKEKVRVCLARFLSF
jgi:hypothetical protein